MIAYIANNQLDISTLTNLDIMNIQVSDDFTTLSYTLTSKTDISTLFNELPTFITEDLNPIVENNTITFSES